jgi:hypothetical protein
VNHAPLPYPIYVYVNNVFLGLEDKGATRGLWHGVHSRLGQELMCHVMLETGAHWSGLPLRALAVKPDAHRTGDQGDAASKWGAMGERLTATLMPYLEGLVCSDQGENVWYRHTGIVIDWVDGWAKVPAEHKPLHLLKEEDEYGYFVLMTNNMVAFNDDHLIKPGAKPFETGYKRGEKAYWEAE